MPYILIVFPIKTNRRSGQRRDNIRQGPTLVRQTSSLESEIKLQKRQKMDKKDRYFREIDTRLPHQCIQTLVLYNRLKTWKIDW